MNWYIDNDDLKNELENYIESCKFKYVEDRNGKLRKRIKKRGKISDKLGEYIKKIAEGLATKGNWRNYTWKRDMISSAIYTTVLYVHNFDSTKYNNAHGYINRICYHAFSQYIQREKNHTNIKTHLFDLKDDIYDLQDEETTSIDYKELK